MAERLAFGEDEMDGCKCPAMAAGVNPNDVASVVGLYDTFASANTGIAWGTLARERALNMWESAIDECRDDEQAQKAREIAEALREE